MAHDFVVIGSGPAAVHAALPLVEAGKNVLMIDGGKESPPIVHDAPPMTFEEIRRTREDQWKWFLGTDLSGIPLGGLEGGLGGGMTSGNRKYVLDEADALLPLERTNAQVIQSLACGGLGAAWGATCAYFDQKQIDYLGLTGISLDEHYDAVTKIIGISGPSGRAGVQQALPMDHHARAMQKSYDKNTEWFRREKMEFRLPHSAVLTASLGERQPNPLRDMDYFADPEKSVYRPQYTLSALKKFPNFTYLPGHVVERLEEDKQVVRVRSRNIVSKEEHTHEGVKVIVAAGAVNTARLLLRSRNMEDVPVPFVGKPHVFTAVFNPEMLGQSGDRERFSLCQGLLVDHQGNGGIESASAQLYSYRSLGLFRLLQSIPLPTPLALKIAAMFSPALIVADIRFPGVADGNTLTLHGDTVRIRMAVSDHQRNTRHAATKRIHAGLRKLGVWPMKTIELPEGSSSHYAGTVPVEERPTLPLSVNSDGVLHGSDRIVIADAAMFRSFPSLPHTLTIMANARRIAMNML